MEFTHDAIVAINEYVDGVRSSLPLPPSTRLAMADHLHDDIVNACTARASAADQSVVGAEIVRDHLITLGTPEECAKRLDEEQRSTRWPGDFFAEAFERHHIGERASRAARTAAQRSERVARASLDAWAKALDIAAQKLREAAERLKSKSDSDK